MADVFSKKKRSEVMSLIKSKHTKPEIAFRKLLSSEFYPNGFRYRLHCDKLPGKPDVVFMTRKVAFFVDGSFWHGYRLKHGGQKLSKKYWLPKIEQNMQRDRRVNAQLKRMGWKVIRVWEHEIYKKPKNVLQRARKALSE